ncbi:MAG: polysaccharide deacetylase family protein [Chitinophagaceae bacterium]
MKPLNILLLVFIICVNSYGQKMVAITIDDVPNVDLYNKEDFHHRLLDKIDSMHLPVTIFINEARIFSTDSFANNLSLFNDWVKDPNVTLGNHGFNHAMYSEIGLDSFKEEVLKGEAITKMLAKKYNKQEKYFRFPYNDLGKDATMHKDAADFLQTKNYIITPFTVHSEDWMITELYTYYKDHGMHADAERTGKAFIKKTVEYFDYIDSLTSAKHGRDVKQVYLMHDVLLNADYMDILVDTLQSKGYTFITLDEALKDDIYKQKDYFQKQPGISWVYRWVKDDKERQALMDKGPNVHKFEKEFEKTQR